ncbi:MAG: rhodanese-like domain-containing protein [Propionibacteriaceae bacterium]|nr:rhodanese-like domain-containing protein [Propionibacteriaceae bacterium]
MKKILVVCLVAVTALLAGCSSSGTGGYQTITAQQAKQMMDQGGSYVLLDVRTQQEYSQQHIDGAILIPDTQVSSQAATTIPDKSTVIFVYCRTGVRAANASKALASMGYTHVYDMGGIVNWPYGTVSG